MRGLAGQGVTGVPDSVLDRSQFGGSGYHQAGNSAGDELDRGGVNAVHVLDRALEAADAASTGQPFYAEFNIS